MAHIIFLAPQTSSREGQTSDSADVRGKWQDSFNMGLNSCKKGASRWLVNILKLLWYVRWMLFVRTKEKIDVLLLSKSSAVSNRTDKRQFYKGRCCCCYQLVVLSLFITDIHARRVLLRGHVFDWKLAESLCSQFCFRWWCVSLGIIRNW